MRNSIPAPPGWPEGLILFDGVCALCSGWVKAVIARDPERRFSFVPIQSPHGRALAVAAGVDPDVPQTNAVALGGRVLFRSEAALAVLGELDGLRWTRAFGVLPRPALDWLYDRVAQNRYAVFGKTDACFVPAPADRARFLDGDEPPAQAKA